MSIAGRNLKRGMLRYWQPCGHAHQCACLQVSSDWFESRNGKAKELTINRPPYLFLVLVLHASIAAGQKVEESTFQTEEPRAAEDKFVSEVDAAQGEYSKELSALKDKLNSKVSEIRDSYVKTLGDLLKKTTQDGNLDEAIRIRDRMKAVSSMEVAVSNSELELATAKKRIQELEIRVAESEAKTRKIDRKSISAVVGTWRWFSGIDVVVGEAGKAITSDGNHGTVQPKDNTPGTFIFTWATGSVDNLTLSQRGNLLEAIGPRGEKGGWAVKLK